MWKNVDKKQSLCAMDGIIKFTFPPAIRDFILMRTKLHSSERSSLEKFFSP